MLVLITYDVSFDTEGGKRRLRNIAKICQDYGIRVQYSVFECDVTPAQWVELKEQLFAAYDPEVDSLRFYKLGKNGQNKIEHFGAKASFDVFKSPLII
ncbi:CRISPR-associated endonuclease Cas2 [Paraneptunicella aestuarii]|uniref:CRISPR-associated endonuclease Cas2 n=1 Tax=Paraneptunicella aestuarii TaxID=2831148 RepID=UPI001E51DB3B|nr:CRISPR-associated endonuclease Cas2 [Paraneptunicella aestuarii]UAA40151.1 CRISPR-associated endonuclease Cas2 [Paraneptunicella aestuarii]